LQQSDHDIDKSAQDFLQMQTNKSQSSGASKTKKIGIWICISLVVGNMIGSGIFLLPASLAPYGGVSIIGWVITALGALMTALVFARMSRRFPKQGGPYRYAYDNFGEFAGFSVAWSYWISIWCGNAAIAVASVTYLGFFWPVLQQSPPHAITVTLIILWSLTLLNTRGVREAGIFQLISTILKFIPLAVLGVAAFFVFDKAAFEPFNLSGAPITSSIAATAALTLWAFLGLESATIPADTVDNPKSTIPKATMWGFIIATVIYITSQVTIMSVVPNAELQQSGAPFADAARYLWGDTAAIVIAIGAVISCLGALNGWILLQGQVPMTAARDGLLPKIFQDKNNDGVSIPALVISSILISILVMANFSEGMVSLFTFAILVSTLGIFIPYLLSIGAEIKLLIKNWKTKQDYFSIISALLALIYYCWAVSGIGAKALLWGIGLVLAGIPIYFLMKLKK
jgi:APA family basic amino acid/polyamine antiporter